MSEISKIGLGTVQFGLKYGISNKNDRTSPEEVTQILRFAEKNNIQVLDTASAYGTAEDILGRNSLKNFKIVSKFLPPKDLELISTQLELSLKKLNVKLLYGYLAHRPLELLKQPEHWKELKALKKKGLMEKIGFSLNQPEEMAPLVNAGFIPDMIQVPYNYFDRRFENLIMNWKNKCEIHTRSTFLQGLFFLNPENIDGFFTEIKPLLLELQNIPNLAGTLLRFVIDKPFIDHVIIGVENTSQIVANLQNIDSAFELPKLEISISNKILNPSLWPKTK